MKLLSKRESGQALSLGLVLLLIGGLTLPPLLALVNTGLKSSQVYEQKTDELYAADTGVEDAKYNLWGGPDHTAPLYDLLHGLGENDSRSYQLPQPVNGLLVDVVVTKLSLIEGLLEEEYVPGPHSPWWSLTLAEQVDDGEYSCEMTVTYTGVGNRQLVTVGAFFAPFPGDTSLIEGPYAITYTSPMTTEGLEDGSPETKVASGGFAFIWKWESPWFNPDDTGTVSFKFKILDPYWSYSDCFVWATFRQPDGSCATNAPGLHKWLIEATAGDTTVRSVVIEDIGALSILTWEIDQPE